MSARKQIQPGEKVPLKLTAAQQTDAEIRQLSHQPEQEHSGPHEKVAVA